MESNGDMTSIQEYAKPAKANSISPSTGIQDQAHALDKSAATPTSKKKADSTSAKTQTTPAANEAVEAKPSKKARGGGKKKTKVESKAKEKPQNKQSATKQGRTAKKTEKESIAPQQDSGKVLVTAERRMEMIQEAAYYIWEQRAPWDSNPEQDWLQAEEVIDLIFYTEG